MSDTKSLLDREAQRIESSHGAMDLMLRRGHRRALRTRVLTIAFAFAVAAGGLTGLFSAFGGTGRAQMGDGGFAGIWPQTTLAAAQAAQSRADAGDPAYTWQLDGQTVLRRFALEHLGWPGFTIFQITAGKGSEAPGYNNVSDLSDPDAAGPFRFITAGCDGDTIKPGMTCPSATLTIQRLLRPDRTGIWSVTKLEDQGVATGAYPSPSG